ncbi:ABC transporter ATP-binding protein [Actinacidiphila yeochonensis]|uniref:ABC transporter ATP-binding protein n=1 Tax=Actinacidiphila yeochonensis TaxID=89050 RepID=UPI00068CC065|nr:ABC transporter ATP-binding protein [Actinacidiphila yeochonensis]
MSGEAVGRSWTSPRELFMDRWRIVLLLPRAGRGLVAVLVVLNVLLGLLPVVFLIATGVVLGRVPATVRAGVGSAEWDSLVRVFLVAAAAFVAQQIVTPLVRSLGELMARNVDGTVFQELMAASLSSAQIGPLEDQRTLEHLRGAASEMEFGVQGPGQACAGLVALIARYTQLAGYAVVVGVEFSWWAAVGLVVAVMVHRYGQRGGLRKYAAVRFRLMSSDRKIGYLRQLSIEARAGKEIRIFGLADWLRGLLRTEYLATLKPIWTERRRVYLWPFIWFGAWGLVVMAVTFGALGASAGDPDRTVKLTSFVLVAQAMLGALRLSEYYPESDVQTGIGMHAYQAVQRFAAAVEAYPGTGPGPAAGAAEPRPAEPRPAVPELVESIRFEDVSFHYPGEDRAIFDGLNLTIPVGQCTAVVGVNGAGKTTLVKLLARLYEPTGGRVLADGVDIRSYPVDEWRAKLGVIFQNFIRYEASAADNIAFGAPAAMTDRSGIRDAADAVGLTAALDGLPLGLDTPLARHLSGGAELSGGQWQRVALARSLFALRHGSPVLVLDEPTASMDVRAEANFFDEFAEISAGATKVLISHRFSTVRHADLIAVLENGRVVEEGNHEELLSQGGRYASLFRLQADRFTDHERPEGALR